MRLLADANVFLEVVQEQEKHDEARALLMETGKHEFFITTFSLSAIGLFLFRRKQYHEFRRFVKDMIVRAGVTMITLLPEDMDVVSDVAQRFALDFDDAYQYAAAEKYDLTIVSFDDDFDRTERKRKTPAEALGS